MIYLDQIKNLKSKIKNILDLGFMIFDLKKL